MKQEPTVQRERSETSLLVVILVGFWLIAIVAWWASAWHADIYTQFGADLRFPTALVISAARAGIPFGIAALSSVLVLYLMVRRAPRTLLLSTWLLCAGTACITFVLLAFTMQIMSMCGGWLPHSPGAFESSESASRLESATTAISSDCVE